MIAVAVPRREFAAALIAADLPASVMRVATWIAEACDWRTGIMGRYISSRGLACEVRDGQRQVRRALSLLRAKGLLDVAERGPLGIPRHALTTPTRPLRWLPDGDLDVDVNELADAPVEPVAAPPPGVDATWWARAKDLARGVVRGVRETWNEEEADDGRGGDLGPGAQAAALIVPFTGGLGPDPSYVPRPRYEPEPRHAPLDAALREDFGFTSPEPDAWDDFAMGPNTRARAERDAPHAVLDLDVEPVPGAWHVGRTFTPDEYRDRMAVPAYQRPPDVRRGPGDDAPHRRAELAYRQAFFAAYGVQPIIRSIEHVAIKRLIITFGLDRTLDMIRTTFVKTTWRHTSRTILWLAHSSGAMVVTMAG